MKKSIVFFAVLMMFFGCAGQSETGKNVSPAQSEPDSAVQKCIELCSEKKAEGLNLDFSPCLSNEIVSGWVCDAAHSPRTEIDNLSENQCSAFREGKAQHFVEVDSSCNLIRTY